MKLFFVFYYDGMTETEQLFFFTFISLFTTQINIKFRVVFTLFASTCGFFVKRVRTKCCTILWLRHCIKYFAASPRPRTGNCIPLLRRIVGAKEKVHKICLINFSRHKPRVVGLWESMLLLSVTTTTVRAIASPTAAIKRRATIHFKAVTVVAEVISCFYTVVNWIIYLNSWATF